MHKLIQGLAKIDLKLSPIQIEQFQIYLEELLFWNQKINLTAITNETEVQVKHFLDCLAVIPNWQKDYPDWANSEIQAIDLGTGAGFPGLVWKIALPHMNWSLLDSVSKKTAFLDGLIRKLNLTGVRTITERAEITADSPICSQKFDLVTARALSSLDDLISYSLPILKPDGQALFLKGPKAFSELNYVPQYSSQLRFEKVEVPFLEEQRFIIYFSLVK